MKCWNYPQIKYHFKAIDMEFDDTIDPDKYLRMELYPDVRWFYVDIYARKNYFTLKTMSGKIITRTAQYYQQVGHDVRICITYKGKTRLVSKNEVLED